MRRRRRRRDGTTAHDPQSRGSADHRARPEPLGLRRLGRRRLGGGGPDSINVLMVNNPQMVDLQKLTADNFTKETGITVNFTVLPENDVRDKISQEFSSQAGPVRRRHAQQLRDPDLRQGRVDRAAGRLHRQGHRVRPGRHPQADDRLAVRATGKVYGEPFYGESSFLMYRKDVLDGQGPHDARATRPGSRSPTSRPRSTAPSRAWRASACAASPAGARSSRRSPRWSTPSAAPGSTRTGRPRSTRPSSRRPTNFYVDLVRDARRERRPAGRVHRVPEQPHPGQRRHVVRRHVGRRLARGGRTPRSRARSATSPRRS